MKRLYRLFFAAVALASFVHAFDAAATSAARPLETDYKALARRLRPAPTVGPFSGTRTVSAYDAAVKLKDLDVTAAPKETNLDKLFEFVRDNRELRESQHPKFDRRAPWMYPYDGCWIRAALVGQWAEREKYSRPMKLFIFGNLQVQTTNAVGGSVGWWYHVVAAVRDTAGDLYVLDPAIDPSKPLPVKDWVLTMVSDVNDASVSLCSAYAYEPYDDCSLASSANEANASSDVSYYLQSEWSNIESLGRDPEKELGDEPPWKQVP